MSAKERDRLKVLHEVGKRHITQKQAAAELGLTARWVRTMRVLAKRPVKGGVTRVRSAEEKARAKQRRLDGRQRWRESLDHLRNRPIWQAVRDAPLRGRELR